MVISKIGKQRYGQSPLTEKETGVIGSLRSRPSILAGFPRFSNRDQTTVVQGETVAGKRIRRFIKISSTALFGETDRSIDQLHRHP